LAVNRTSKVNSGSKGQMNSETLDETINVRLSSAVYKALRRLAKEEDLKVADIIRRAIRQTYGLPKSK